MEEQSEVQTTHSSGTGFIKSCYNASNSFIGIGILALPYGLSKGGWLTLILLSLIACMAFWTAILIKRCMQAHRSIRSYEDIGDLAFGRIGRVIVSFLMNMELYLVAISLMIMEGDSLHKLFPRFKIELGELTIEGKQSFIIITALIILPSVLLTNLGILSYVSAMGMSAIIVIVISILCVGAIGGVGFHGNEKLLIIDGIPTSIGLFIVCFGGHAVVPTLYMSMKNTNQFPKVMLVTFVFTYIIYMMVAVVGYLMYGGSVEPEITLNLPAREISSKVAIFSTLVIPICRYALVMTPVATAIENGVLHNYSDKRSIRLFIRIMLLISTTVIACAFPYFESLMAVVGSLFVVLVSFLLPCCCYLKISGAYRNYSYELMGIIAMILSGCFAGVIGTYSFIVDLIHKT